MGSLMLFATTLILTISYTRSTTSRKIVSSTKATNIPTLSTIEVDHGNSTVDISSSEKWQTNCRHHNWSISLGCNISGLLDALLAKYDRRLRPFMDDQKPVEVVVGFWILSIDSINVIDMDYQIDFFFRQSWRDPRLKHSYPSVLTVSNSMLEKIWVPDTYFENSKNSHFHHVTVPNKMLKISPDGVIMYNARISVRASCPMDLRMFPMDVQECALNIESYGYSTRDITYKWEDGESRISIGAKVRTLPQYNLTGFRTDSRMTVYVVGNWSGLVATFVLERRTGYFFLHLYGPCALIVMISWISFCIPKESTPARVALGITSVLTITTILNMLNTAMPKVSYIKAVDWYLIVSFLFVFAVLLEYTLILYLTDKAKQANSKLSAKPKRKTSEKSRENQTGSRNGSTQISEYQELRSRLLHSQESNNNHEIRIYESTTENSKNGKRVSHTLLPIVVPTTPSSDTKGELQCAEVHQLCSHVLWQFRIDLIDEYSRTIFPVAFAAFNTVYWLLFFGKKTS